MALVFDKLRWVHHDNVELLTLVAILAQQFKYIITQELSFAQIEFVQLNVLLRNIKRILRGVHADNLATSAHQSRNRKTTGIRETVQHTLIFHILASGKTAVTLVKVVTRFMAAFDIDQQLHAVLFDWQ
ncbi:hypothetical protein D3C81_1890530 [compost metagenome]